MSEQLAEDGLTKVKVVKGDMEDYKSMNAAAEEVSSLVGGGVDYLIVNGAYLPEGTAMLSPTQFVGQEELLLEEFNHAILTNAIGPIFTVNAFLPLMRAGKAKKIVVTSTGMADMDAMGVSGVAASVPYAASKAAVNLITAKFALDLKPDEITIIALSPGLVKTGARKCSLVVNGKAVQLTYFDKRMRCTGPSCHTSSGTNQTLRDPSPPNRASKRS